MSSGKYAHRHPRRSLGCAFEERDLHILNDGSPTFVQSTLLSSCLDLTVASASIAWSSRWQVDADTMGSDHLPVLVNIQHSRTERRSARVARIPEKFTAVDAEYERLRALRHREERRARRTSLPEHTSEARRVQKAVHRHLVKLARTHWRNFATSLSPRTPLSRLWSVLKGLHVPVSQRQPFRSLSLASGRQELEIAEEYCDRLASAPTNSLALSMDIPIVLESSSEPLLDIPFSLAELESALENAPVHTSPIADRVSYKALRNLPLCPRQSLLSIFNASWVAGSVPTEWKCAMVIPILKPGKSPHNIDSFRPIALTSCIGKTFERMVHSRLASYVESTGFFPQVMAGFRQGTSAVDNVIAVTSSAQQARSEGLHTAAVFLDVMKAYDSVLHSTVVATLQEAGVEGRMLSWIQDFLSDRSLFMRTTEGDTQSFPVRRGVPQGSVLSPLPFNVVMASIPAHLRGNVSITIYADGICLWTSGTRCDGIQRRLQGAFDDVVQYLSDRGLSVSSSRTVAMAFTPRSFRQFPLRVAGLPVEFVPHPKYLGITIHWGLTWSKHIKALSSQLSVLVNVLRRISGTSWDPTCTDLKLVHTSLVTGTLRYSHPVLHAVSKANERELLIICLGVPKTTDTYQVLAEGKEPPAHILRDLETLRAYSRYLTRHPAHHLRDIDHDCSASAFGAAVRRLKVSVPSTASTSSYTPPIWSMVTPTVYIHIPGITSKNDHPPPVLWYLVLEHLDALHSQPLQIYTDGSVSAGVSTAALFLPSENIEQAFKLPHETSSTEAELVAIHEALKLVSAGPLGSWTVLTDSKSALEALSSPRSQDVSDIRSLILIVHNLLVTSGHSVWFQWVPSHIVLPGNTRADTAAKRAHGAAECNTVIALSPSVCRIHIRRHLPSDTRLFMENTVAANTFLHRIDPKMAFSVSLRLSRKEESALHRLRLNVARTPSLLFKIKQCPSSACPSCSTDADTHHLLLTCLRYTAPRTALTHRLSALGHRDLSLAALLGPVGQKQWAVTRALICFLGDSGLLDCL
ncbi:uncharacterized protein LOC135373313 [Ornithodoros turicata]|uniref:uncharacterized protein LOC135373313 n=1 Tax=Ornithodoros turicata TaxID=34597 RepID=UPI0031391D65